MSKLVMPAFARASLQRVMHCAAVLALAAAMSGCAVMKYNYNPEEKEYFWPENGSVVTVKKGENILIQGKRAYSQTLVIKAPVDGHDYGIPAGRYPMVGEDEDRVYFAPMRTQTSIDSDAAKGLFINKGDSDVVCVATDWNGSECYRVPVKMEQTLVPSKTTIEKFLVFQGRVDDMIDLVYVEKKGQDVLINYNVSFKDARNPKSRKNPRTVIRYGGAALVVEACTDASITCQVLSNLTPGEFATQYAKGVE